MTAQFSERENKKITQNIYYVYYTSYPLLSPLYLYIKYTGNNENSATGTLYPRKYFLAGHKIRSFSFHFTPLFCFLSFSLSYSLLRCPLYGFNFRHKESFTLFFLVVECVCFYYTHKISFKILFVFAYFYSTRHKCTSTYC